MDFLKRKQYPIDKFILSGFCALISLLALPSLFAVWAEEEGTLGQGVIQNLLADLFFVLRFPAHLILWPLINYVDILSFPLFLIGLAFNVFFYSIIIERLITLTRMRKKRKATPPGS